MSFEYTNIRDYYIQNIKAFMDKDTTVDYLCFDRECDLPFLRGILKEMGFKIGNRMLQDTIKPQFLPYFYNNQEVYLHFNPVVFRIGLMKKSMWDKILDENSPELRKLLTAIYNNVMKSYTVEDCLVCSYLYEWLIDSTVVLPSSLDHCKVTNTLQ